MIEPETKRKRADALYQSLLGDRVTFEAHWRELADYFLPRRPRWWSGDRNKGDRRNQNIINNTGTLATRTLQSGLHAGLTSPARPWMKLTLVDHDLLGYGSTREWLHDTTERMLALFTVSNLYNVLPIVYGDMGLFGTGAMAILEDADDIFRCYAYPLGSYVLGMDRRGKLCTFGRVYELTVRQVVEEFALADNGRDIDWTKLSTTVKREWDAGRYETPIEVCWMVLPNVDANPERLASKYLPFASLYWETGAQQPVFLRESGFRLFPVMAPRWGITGEDTYGTESPGIDALGDCKQLQIMERRKGQAISKMVDPPLQGPSALRQQKTSLLPGDITYIDVREGTQGLRAIHEVNLNLEHLGRDIQAVEYRIKRSFFEDLFLMLATIDPYRGASPPTAREVEERHEEKLLALGPVLERTNDELLDPMVDRVFDIMIAAGKVPPPPSEIQGRPLKPEYISILAQAQKMVGVGTQDRFMTTLIPTMEVFPEVRAKVKIHQIIDNYADMLGIDPHALRDTEEAERMNAEQAQAEAAAAGAQQAKDLAQAMKAGSETKMGQDSALDRIVQAAATPPPVPA